MCTTLSIVDDVLLAVKEQGRREGRTAGEVLSTLARQALAAGTAPGTEPADEFLGFRPLPRRGVTVSNALVDRLREQEGV